MKTRYRFRVRPRLLALCLAGAAAIGAGCASRSPEPGIDKSTAGQIIGGAAGAAAGSQIGDGSGRTVAMIAGALIGSVVGERIGARLEQQDLRLTATALESNRSGQTASWVNPDTGNEFWVTPTDTYEHDGLPCRRFDFRVQTNLGSEIQQRTACRQSDGTWEVLG